MSILVLAACTDTAPFTAESAGRAGVPQVPEAELAERVGFSTRTGLLRFAPGTGRERSVAGAALAEAGEAPPPPPYAIGADDDTVVSDPTAFPYSTAVKLYLTWGEDVWVCSGTLIAAATVLTAGHCMYDAIDGKGWVDSIEVVPGLDGEERPYDSAWGVTFTTYHAWTDDADFAGDMGFVSLDRSVGLHAGYLDREYDDDASYYTGTSLNMNSYPAASWGDGLTQYHAYDAVIDTDDDIVYHELDTTGGTSGGGLYRYDKSSGARYLRANNSFETVDGSGTPIYNGGVRFSAQRWADLSAFIAEETDAVDLADLRDEGSALASRSVATGEAVQIGVAIANRGTADATGVAISIVLSDDRSISGDDVVLGGPTCDVSAFGVCSGSLSYELPDSVQGGRWNLFVQIDATGDIDEYDESDNTVALGSVNVDRDLDDDGFDDDRFGGPDCDDDDAGRNPSAEEVCDNGVDEDCTGDDEACPVEPQPEDEEQDSAGGRTIPGQSTDDEDDEDDDDDDGSRCGCASPTGGHPAAVFLLALAALYARRSR